MGPKTDPESWNRFRNMAETINRRIKFENGQPNAFVGEFYPELNSKELVSGAKAVALWVALFTASKKY